MRISRWKAGYAILVLLGIAYGYVVLRGPHGIPGLMEKRSQIQDYEKRNEILHREIEEKKSRINRLRDSPEEQELEIRRRLKLVKPEDKVFILQEQNKEVPAQN